MATKNAESWEDQIEGAFMANVDAIYEMFMALDMDKDVGSHLNIKEDTWSKLDKIMEDHKEIMKQNK